MSTETYRVVSAASGINLRHPLPHRMGLEHENFDLSRYDQNGFSTRQRPKPKLTTLPLRLRVVSLGLGLGGRLWLGCVRRKNTKKGSMELDLDGELKNE